MKVFGLFGASGKRFLKIIFWVAGRWGKYMGFSRKDAESAEAGRGGSEGPPATKPGHARDRLQTILAVPYAARISRRKFILCSFLQHLLLCFPSSSGWTCVGKAHGGICARMKPWFLSHERYRHRRTPCSKDIKGEGENDISFTGESPRYFSESKKFQIPHRQAAKSF
jgi:hypothetical protein